MQLKMGNGEPIIPRNAWWSLKDKVCINKLMIVYIYEFSQMLNFIQKFMEPKGLEHWAVVNFSSSCDVRKTCLELAKISLEKGMVRLSFSLTKSIALCFLC